MTEQNTNTVTIDGVDYDVETLDEQQQYLVAQLRSLAGKAQTLQFDLDQVTAAKNVFTNMLTDSVKEETEEVEGE